MFYYALALTIVALVLVFVFDAIQFQPTKYWLASKFKIYKVLSRYEDINIIDIKEVEAMLYFLIISRCSEENRAVIEIRNGLLLKYYPESVDKNKRWYDGDYLEIYHKSCKTILRVCFCENTIPRFQIEMPKENGYLETMFLRSKQGNIRDFSKYAYTDEGVKHILDNYRDYLIRRVM